MKRAAWSPVLPVDAVLVALAEDGREEDVTDLMMEARGALGQRVHASLGSPDGEVASVMTDIVVRHILANLTGLEVIATVQSRPELVLATRKSVAAIEARRGA